MKKYLLLMIFLMALTNFTCGNSFKLFVKNSANYERIDALIKIPIEKLRKKNSKFLFNSFSVFDGIKEIPYQIVKKGERITAVLLLLDFKPAQSKILTFISGEKYSKGNYSPRTYAELAVMKNGKFDGKRVHGTKYENISVIKVPKEHIDHDGLFKYEGPGWESDKVGYRFYLDWRNATDIFGKKTDKLVLQSVGVTDTIADNNESFHTMQEWGMDIFKVGSSLGIGSFGMWSEDKVNMVSKCDSTRCEIIMNGPINSEIRTVYFGWSVGNMKYTVESSLSISAGSRLSKNSLAVFGYPQNIVTGFAKYPGTSFIKNNSKKGWNYIGLYGHQSLADDNLGIALFYKSKDLIELTEDKLSYIVKLRPGEGRLEYYFCAAWEKELNGIKSEKEFKEYLDKVVMELNIPIIVE